VRGREEEKGRERDRVFYTTTKKSQKGDSEEEDGEMGWRSVETDEWRNTTPLGFTIAVATSTASSHAFTVTSRKVFPLILTVLRHCTLRAE
jgi:hypothetical protein